MSMSRGSSAGNGAGAQPIPAGSRKVVQSLKEIVNCSEAEIYAALKDCNMDPNEAVNRLLSQDPFHEVKRKREKKKEGIDNSGSRPRNTSTTSKRGGKSGLDRPSGRSSASYNVSESLLPGKGTHKRENGSTQSNYLSSVYGSENNRSRGPSSFSDSTSSERKGSLMGNVDGVPSATLGASGYQSSWGGIPGQVSMADIVRMGRTHNKTSNVSQHNFQPTYTVESLHDQISTEDDISKVHQASVQHSVENPDAAYLIPTPDYTAEYELHGGAPNISFNGQIDEVKEREDDNIESSVEKQDAAYLISDQEYSSEYECHPGALDGGSFNGVELHPQAIEVQGREDDGIGGSERKDAVPVSVSSRKIQDNDSRGASLFENDLYNSGGFYQSEAHDFEQQEDDEDETTVSAVTRNMQNLSVERDDNGHLPEENAPTVTIPDHFQQEAAVCPHLSFGSFRPAMSTAYSAGTMASVPANSNLDLTRDETEISSVGHSDIRHSEYHEDGTLRNVPESGLFHGAGASGANYDTPPVSQPEELKTESADAVPGMQYSFPSNPGYSFEDTANLTATFSQTTPQMPNLAQFSNVMHQPANSLPSTSFTGNAHPSRESDIHYSAFPMPQSMPSKYGNTVSSVGSSPISMSEALRNAALSSSQPALQNLSGTNVPTGPPLPQQLALHPYSQHALPLGPYTNMIGYPFLPQSYAYLPSAFPQSLAGSNTFHQSVASVLPQYKSSVSVSSLPQSGAVASGYGAVPGNFSTIPSAAPPSGPTLNYEDVLSSQYKDAAAHLLSQQQNENLAAWLHGANTRTMPAHYNYPGNNQPLGGVRQGQQQTQSYGAPGYPNFYLSQTGLPLDQLQNPRDGSLSNPQGQPKQSQIWPNGY